MGTKLPPTFEPGTDDLTPAAKLVIRVGPSQLAEGTVPPEQARHLITTFGILGCVFAGVGSAVLTLHIAASLAPLAWGELVLALAGAVLIAIGSRTAAGKAPGHRRSKVSGRRSGR
jgi:hypothetical protein